MFEDNKNSNETKEIIKIINPKNKMYYDIILNWAKKITKNYCGKLFASINPDLDFAIISLELPCYDFSNDDEREFISYIMKHSDSLSITPILNNNDLINITIELKYFTTIDIEK